MSNDTDQWPPMAEPEFGEDGYAIAGTTPISVVSIGAWGAHNKPAASIRSAGCAYCDRWAVDLYVGQASTRDGDFFNTVERRADFTLIYFCDQHQENASEELLEKYGSAGNWLDVDLAQKVTDYRVRAKHETAAHPEG